MKEEIISKKGMKAVGPYSQAIKYCDLIFCSGNIGVDPATNNMIEGGVQEQTKRALENIKDVLISAHSSLDNVLKTTVYLKNMDDFMSMNEVYATVFNKPYPARATIEVARLPKGALVEIECIAYINKKVKCCSEDCSCCS